MADFNDEYAELYPMIPHLRKLQEETWTKRSGNEDGPWSKALPNGRLGSQTASTLLCRMFVPILATICELSTCCGLKYFQNFT